MRARTTARVANVSLQADRYQTGVWGSGGSPSLRFPLGFGFRVFWRCAAVARCRRGAEQRTSGMPPVRSRPASNESNGLLQNECTHVCGTGFFLQRPMLWVDRVLRLGPVAEGDVST